MRIALAILLAAVLAVGVSGVAIAVEPAPTGEVSHLRADVRELAIKLEDQAEARTRQADAFNADALTISIVSGVGILFITLGGIAVTILSYRFIQRQVADHITNRMDSSIRTHGAEVFEREAGALRDEYEERFDQLYRRAKNLPTSG